jgi:hypothetical protein
MSGQGDQDSFVARWSRLKRESARREKEARAEARAPERDHRAADAERAAGTAGDARAADAGSEAPFDPATLPPIDSIVASSDIRAFLQKGVPAELATAALRRAWTTDPAIRDFIGIAENQWDFTDPTAIPGFGPLEATSDLRQLVAQAVGDLPTAPDPADLAKDDSKDASAAGQAEACAAPTQEHGGDKTAVEPAAIPQDPQTPAGRRIGASRRGHGGALPS